MATIVKISRPGGIFPVEVPPSEWPVGDQNTETSLPGTDGYGVVYFSDPGLGVAWTGTEFILSSEEADDLGMTMTRQRLYINYSAENNVEFYAQQGDGAWITGNSGPGDDANVTVSITENFLTAYATLSIFDTTLEVPVTVKEWAIETTYSDGGSTISDLKVNVNGAWEPASGGNGTLYVKTPDGWKPASGSLWVRTPDGWKMS